MKPVILCDVDGVIADFSNTVIGYALDVYAPATVDFGEYDLQKAMHLDDQDWNECVEYIISEEFAMGIEPYLFAVDAVRELMKIGDLYFVTSHWWSSKTWCYDRTQWLVEQFGPAVREKIIFTHSKHRISGDVMIEDRADVLEGWAKEQSKSPVYGKPLAILVDRPYNREADDHIRRVTSWRKIIELVGSF